MLYMLLCLSLDFQSLPGYAYLKIRKHSHNTSKTKSSTGRLQFCHPAIIPGVIFGATPLCVPSLLLNQFVSIYANEVLGKTVMNKTDMGQALKNRKDSFRE